MIREVLRPYRLSIAVIGLAFFAANALETLPVIIVKQLVDRLSAGRGDDLLKFALVYYGIRVATPTVNGYGIYRTSVVAQSALHALRVRLFAHLQRLPMSYFDLTPIGDIISRGTADIETVDTLFSSGVAILVSFLLSLLTTSVAMVYLSVPLSIVAALILPALVAITQFFRVRVRAAERANRIATGGVNTHLQETLSGIEVIRAFRREAVFSLRFRRALHALVQAENRSTVYNSFYPPLMAMLSSVLIALLLWLGISGTLAVWGITLGTLTAFVLLFRGFFQVIIDVGDQWQTVQSALSGLERIAQVLDLPAEETPIRVTPNDTQYAIRHSPFAIAFEHVTFGYLERRPVVRDLTLHVRAGEHVALVGRTGAGKTSTLHLLAGLYAPWDGVVRVAGIDPRALSADERSHIVGVVPQFVQLFSGSVYDNLTLGDPRLTRAAVERAACITGADEFIRALPQGYDTLLSSAGRGGGAQLSAGQRQLLALTRALVWNPRVLLLDEATAAIDNASEAAFRAALRTEMQHSQRAVLTVAHRLSTAREADRVIVMEAGRIVEEGAPDELMRRGGRFAALVELEAAGWEWRAAPTTLPANP